MLETLPADAVQSSRGGFGSGGSEPYEQALLGGTATLRLQDVEGAARGTLSVARFLAPADAVDRALLRRIRGPVLDIGCGPGRMVRAALDAGTAAIGIDTSAAAVGIARAAGLPVLHASVFDPLPADPVFGGLLLLDGNIGIGGDPARLLRRCAQLLAPGGALLVEADREQEALEPFAAVLLDDAGVSAAFPWATVGAAALARLAPACGLRVGATSRMGDRVFIRLESLR